MPRAAKAVKNPYSVHPGVAMVQDWIATLPEKTGRSLDQWLTFIEKNGPPTEKERRDWLKNEHGMGTNSAWWLAERAEGKGEDEDPEQYLQTAVQYVEDMFAGPKASLRPIYDKLLDLCLKFKPDVKACPCKTIVPIYRKNVIAQIKPTTRTRIDFGYALGDMKATGRLIDTGGFAKKDRITHRIEITSLADIDAEVKRWLEVAYKKNADK
jgi:predicted GTPase